MKDLHAIYIIICSWYSPINRVRWLFGRQPLFGSRRSIFLLFRPIDRNQLRKVLMALDSGVYL